MFFATLCLATLLSYRGTIALPYDAASGYVGILLDGTNDLHRCTLRDPTITTQFSPGDKVEVEVEEKISHEGLRFNRSILSLRVVGHGPAPVFQPISAVQLNRGEVPGLLVSVTGTVRDICTEGHDARWFLLVLQDGDDYGYVSVEKRDDETMDVDRLLGARVRVVGCHSSTSPQRQAMCSCVSPDSLRMITVLAPSPAIEETSVPDISDMRFQNIGDNALDRLALNTVNLLIQNAGRRYLELIALAAHGFDENGKAHFAAACDVKGVGGVLGIGYAERNVLECFSDKAVVNLA